MDNKKKMKTSHAISKRKGQIWGMDLVVAALIFSVALAFFYFYVLNDRDAPKETIETLQYGGKIITDNLLSEGSPTTWNETHVSAIGILSEGKINQTKLDSFYILAATNYNHSRTLFNTPYHYYFFLDTNMTANGTTIEGIGKPGTTKNNINAKNLIRISRITIYENKPTGATLYIWEE